MAGKDLSSGNGPKKEKSPDGGSGGNRGKSVSLLDLTTT